MLNFTAQLFYIKYALGTLKPDMVKMICIKEIYNWKNCNFKQVIKITDRIQPLESLSKKPHEPKIIVNLRRVKRKIMIMSGKGGVGKSTVDTNLAIGLALHGYNVGLLDCDIHGPTTPTISVWNLRG